MLDTLTDLFRSVVGPFIGAPSGYVRQRVPQAVYDAMTFILNSEDVDAEVSPGFREDLNTFLATADTDQIVRYMRTYWSVRCAISKVNDDDPLPAPHESYFTFLADDLDNSRGEITLF
jgi:hypothetical protein